MIARGHGKPRGEKPAALPQCEGDIGSVGKVISTKDSPPISRLVRSRAAASRAENGEDPPARQCVRRGNAAGASSTITWAFVPADAKRVHARAPATLAARASPQPVAITRNGEARKSNRLFGVRKFRTGRQAAMAHRLDHLDQAGHPRRRIQMPDVRLDAADPD